MKRCITITAACLAWSTLAQEPQPAPEPQPTTPAIEEPAPQPALPPDMPPAPQAPQEPAANSPDPCAEVVLEGVRPGTKLDTLPKLEGYKIERMGMWKKKKNGPGWLVWHCNKCKPSFNVRIKVEEVTDPTSKILRVYQDYKEAVVSSEQLQAALRKRFGAPTKTENIEKGPLDDGQIFDGPFSGTVYTWDLDKCATIVRLYVGQFPFQTIWVRELSISMEYTGATATTIDLFSGPKK